MSTHAPFGNVLRGSSTRNVVVFLAGMIGILFSQSLATASGFGILWEAGDNSAGKVLFPLHAEPDGDFHSEDGSFVAELFYAEPGMRVYLINCEGVGGWLYEDGGGWRWSLTTPGFVSNGSADFFPFIDDYDGYYVPPPPWWYWWY